MFTILVVVTFLSLGLASIMSVVALRAVRDARRRSDARIAALARDIAGGDLPLQSHAADGSVSGLFAEIQDNRGRSRAPLALAAGAVIVGTAFALAMVLSSGRPAASSGVEDGEARQDAVTIPPLELVALGHERTGDMLTIRGVVRNPANGRDMRSLSALVLLVAGDGRELASARAPVHEQTLRPDTQTSFLVTVPDTPGVAKYRVSFLAADRVVPHIDKRDGR